MCQTVKSAEEKIKGGKGSKEFGVRRYPTQGGLLLEKVTSEQDKK